MEKYQTFGPRFLALIIDSLVLIPLWVINFALTDLELSPLVWHLWALVMTLAAPFYAIVMLGLYGQTLGKMAMKVKVLDANENPITFQHAVLRALPQIFFGLMLIFFQKPSEDSPVTFTAVIVSLLAVSSSVWSIADIIVFFANDKKRALHDLLAGTVVVNIKR